MADDRLGAAQQIEAIPLMPQLAALFVVVQIIEIWLLIKVGQAIGGWQTLLLLVADSLLGAWLVRREGRRTWRAFRLALDERRVPAREVADGALVLVGGTLLLTPGFLSDIVGVLFLLPPTRAAIRPMLTRLVAARFGVVGVLGDAAMRSRRGSAYKNSTHRNATVINSEVVEGEVVEGEVVEGEVVEGEVVDPGQHEGPPPGGGRP